MGKRLKIEGISVDVPSGDAEATVDFTLTKEIEFYGVSMCFENPVFGDEIDLRLIAPDGVTVAHDYSNNCKLTSTLFQKDVLVGDKDDPATIQAGLILRFKYTAVDTNGRKAQVWFRIKE